MSAVRLRGCSDTCLSQTYPASRSIRSFVVERTADWLVDLTEWGRRLERGLTGNRLVVEGI